MLPLSPPLSLSSSHTHSHPHSLLSFSVTRSINITVELNSHSTIKGINKKKEKKKTEMNITFNVIHVSFPPPPHHHHRIQSPFFLFPPNFLPFRPLRYVPDIFKLLIINLFLKSFHDWANNKKIKMAD